MDGPKDYREDIVNALVMWASAHGIDSAEAKYDFFMLLNNVEITSRCTEIVYHMTLLTIDSLRPG